MPVTAYVLVKTKPGTSAELVSSRRIKGVKMADSVFGRFDAVLVITAKDMNELSKVLYEVIEKHPNVLKTETLISIPYPPTKKPPTPPPERVSLISIHCPSCNALVERGLKFCPYCEFPLEG
jgi:hypothetical protein